MAATVRQAVSGEDMQAVVELMTEYVSQLPFELTFQDFALEMEQVDFVYGHPKGRAFLAEVDGAAMGVCGLTLFDGSIAELKRMYLRPETRGRGLGRLLADHAIALARSLGYDRIRLDTVDSLTEAISLYESLGFVEIDAYRHNPRPDARFFELDLGKVPQPDPIGVVLVGGSSARMGDDKPSLEIGGLPMREHVAAALESAGLRAVEIGKSDDAAGLAGPLAGLLGAMREHPGADIFLAAADQPYLRPKTVTAMLGTPGDVVIPFDECPQTTCALYRYSFARDAETAGVVPHGSLRSAVVDLPGRGKTAGPSARANFVDPTEWRAWGEDGRSWLSLDRPEELEAARAAWPEPPQTSPT